MQISTSISPLNSGYRARSTNWTSVRLLNVYRLGLAAIFFAQSFVSPSPLLNIVYLPLYSWTSFAFLLLAMIWVVAAWIERRGFRSQVTLQMYSDTIIIILLMHACGGISSGLGMLLIISVAISGLLTEQALAILFASLASLGLMTEHIYSVINIPGYTGTSTQVGILGASLVATAIVTHNLMTRVRSSEQLVQQRERDVALLSALNQEVIENLQAGVVVLSRNDNIRHINQAALDMLHLANIKSISLQKNCPKLLAALESWRNTPEIETPMLPSQTGIDNIQISFRELHSEGQPNTLIFLNDVSSIRDSMQQAKLASLGHLTASIAHEIRNPLGAISYAAELLNENEDFSEADLRMIEIINQHTARINNIIEDILKISRSNPTVKEQIDLADWLPGFIDKFCQSGLARPETFEFEIEIENPRLLFDTGHLTQILTNLCTNACVHGGSDKPIAIRVFATEAYPLCIEVADQGPGVDTAILDQIFEPFYTTSHQGSGLGLYICGQLCELNNAFITARINQHNGTSFILQMTSLAIEPVYQVNQ
ncbi:MAG: PAS domain-containing sensor histidine kinase [Gammaproteobacteria bacterium]|nr:PAS domain-containing sensor histidine kinase [Gammaproteobacteria bacterium]